MATGSGLGLLFESPVHGPGVEVTLLTDLTPAELTVIEIPSLLEIVSQIHDVLVRGPSFGILLFLSPEGLLWQPGSGRLNVVQDKSPLNRACTGS